MRMRAPTHTHTRDCLVVLGSINVLFSECPVNLHQFVLRTSNFSACFAEGLFLKKSLFPDAPVHQKFHSFQHVRSQTSKMICHSLGTVGLPKVGPNSHRNTLTQLYHKIQQHKGKWACQALLLHNNTVHHTNHQTT